MTHYVVYSQGNDFTNNGNGAYSTKYVAIIPWKHWRVVNCGWRSAVAGTSTIAEQVNIGIIISDIGATDDDYFGSWIQSNAAGKNWAKGDMFNLSNHSAIAAVLPTTNNGNHTVVSGVGINVWQTKQAVITCTKKNVTGSTTKATAWVLIEIASIDKYFVYRNKYFVYTTLYATTNGQARENHTYICSLPVCAWRVIDCGFYVITDGTSGIAEQVAIGTRIGDNSRSDDDLFGLWTQDTNAGKNWVAGDMISRLGNSTIIATPNACANGGTHIFTAGNPDGLNVWNNKQANLSISKEQVANGTATVIGWVLIEIDNQNF